MSVDIQPVVALVHGCTQGPTGWARVQALLEDRGVRSVAIDLDPQQLEEASALECAEEISRQLEPFDRVVLVGTSCSGILIPVVTMVRPIEHLVFFCAGLPEVGRSTTAQVIEDGVLCHEWMNWPGAYDDPEAARRFMFHDCPGEDLAWSLSTVRLWIPQLAYDEITPLRSWPSIPCTYVVGTQDRIINAEWVRSTVPARLGVEPVEIETGHCPQNSRPDLVSALLSEVAVPES